MCVEIGSRIRDTLAPVPMFAISPITGGIDAVIKIAATVASIFECVIPEEINKKINQYAKDGLKALSGKNFLWSFSYLPPEAFLFLRRLILGYTKKDDKFKKSFGDELQHLLFKKAFSLRNKDFNSTFTHEVLARLAFFGATLVTLIAKVGQLALGLLAAALSLASLYGLFGSFDLKKLYEFAYSNLFADFIETLCDGLRYTFHPDRALKEGYASRYERIG